MKPIDLLLLPLYMLVFLCAKFVQVSLELGIYFYANALKLSGLCEKRLFLVLDTIDFPPLPQDKNQKSDTQSPKEISQGIGSGDIENKVHTSNSTPTALRITVILPETPKQSR